MWTKLVHPFLILTMILLSIPILFGSARSTGLGGRLFLGVMIGLAYYLVSRAFFFLAVHFGLGAWLAATLPVALFALVGLWVLHRVN